MITIGIKYFAALREQAGKAGEQRDTPPCTAGELYAALRKEYGFTLSAEHIKVAVNEEYRTFEHVLVGGDEVVFIPPVSGG